MSGVPQSSNPYIADFISAFRRRSRALNYKFPEVNCAKVIEKDGDVIREKIELTLRRRAKSPKNLTIRVFFWEDRWTWIDAREADKLGWKFEWTTEGRLSGNKRGADIIEGVERTYDFLSALAGPEIPSEISKLWNAVLLNGPIRSST